MCGGSFCRGLHAAMALAKMQSQKNNEADIETATPNEDVYDISGISSPGPFTGVGIAEAAYDTAAAKWQGQSNNEPDMKTATAANEDASIISGTPAPDPFTRGDKRSLWRQRGRVNKIMRQIEAAAATSEDVSDFSNVNIVILSQFNSFYSLLVVYYYQCSPAQMVHIIFFQASFFMTALVELIFFFNTIFSIFASGVNSCTNSW